MRRIVFAVGVLTTSTSFCLGKNFAHKPETLLNIQEWEEMNTALPSHNDLITLLDGAEVNGTIEKLPSIEYSFGRLDFNPHEVTVIAFSPSLNKMQIITRHGHNFVGDFPKGNIVFYETDSVTGKKIFKEFDINLINFIVFKERGEVKPPQHKRYHSLLFKNGDRIPVALASDSLQFSNGFEDFSVLSEEISSISFNDGFEGVQVGKDGIKRKIAGSCIKGDYLCVHLAKGKQEIHFPWRLISAIESDFKQTTFAYPKEGKGIHSASFASEEKTPYHAEPLFSDSEEYDIPTDIAFKRDISSEILALVEDTLFDEEIELLEDPEETQEPDEEEVTFVSETKLSPRKVTNSEYKEYLEATCYLPPSHWEQGEIPVGKEDQPVVNVSYNDALMYALWANKRLPTEEEISQADLEDHNDGMSEWTTSVPADEQVSEGSKPKHQVVGESPASMGNTACSDQVGFRCAE